MKIKNLLNTYNILSESMLANEWTWGFELEGICKDNGEYTLPRYHEYNEDPNEGDVVLPTGVAWDLKLKLDELFGVKGKMERDGSLRTSAKFGGFPFEYPSGVLKFNVKEIENVLDKLYNGLPKLNVYTNRSCGFHTHFSNNALDKSDVMWILCYMALNDEMRKELKELNTKADEKEESAIKNLVEKILWHNKTGEITDLPASDVSTDEKKITLIRNNPDFGDIQIKYDKTGTRVNKIIISDKDEKDTYERGTDKDFYNINYNDSGEIESIEGGINFFNERYAGLGFFNEVRNYLIDIYLFKNHYFYRYKGSRSSVEDLPKEGNKIGDTFAIPDANNNYDTLYYFWTGKDWKNITKELSNENRKKYISLNEDPYQRINRLFDESEKFRVINTHAQGTIEWRGPRNFLSTGKREIISTYLKKCYKLLIKMSNIIDKKEFTAKIDKQEIIDRMIRNGLSDVEGISISDTITVNREDLEKNINPEFKFNSPFEKSKIKKNPEEGFINDMVKNPEKILKLRIRDLGRLIEKGEIFEKIPVEIFSRLWNKLSPEDLKQLKISYGSYINRWLNKMNQSGIDYIVPKEVAVIQEKKHDWSTFEDIYLYHINYFPKEYMKNKYVDDDRLIDKNIVNYLKTKNNELTMDDWAFLINTPKFWDALYYLNIPPKIQMRLVKKNPYFIQYIKNPTDSAINMAKKKVDNIDQFISRI